MRARRYDVDWLRVLAMLVVFYFHSAKLFDLDWFHIKNAQLSFGLTVFTSFAWAWIMPLFFLLSGIGTRFSLDFRTGRQYVWERFKRLFVPFLFGTLVIIPPQVYLERIRNSQFHGSYLQFYPHFFSGIYPRGNFSWHHLWFLIYLFVFSVIALPLFLHLRKEPGRRFVSRFASFCRRRGRLFLLALPIAAIEVTLRPKFPGLQTLISDWANFFTYLTLFIYGYLLAADQQSWEAIAEHWKVALAAAFCATGVVAFILIRYDPQPGYSAAYALTTVLRALTSWFWLIAFLGAAQRYLNFTNSVLRYASQAVLPFYVLHQTVIIMIGFYVVMWPLGIMPKYLIISSAAFAATVLAYDLLVRRTNPTRILFGMRPLEAGPRPSPAEAASQG